MGSSSDPIDTQMANVPFRFYFVSFLKFYFTLPFFQPSFPFRQLLFPLIKKHDSNVSTATLTDVIEKAFPEHCPFDDQHFEVISHGIDLPLGTSVYVF